MNIGEINTLNLLRFTTVGAYLGDQEDNDVLLPNKYLTPELEVGQEISVFVYCDSEDRIVATTERPTIELNGFAFLKIKEVNLYGAFADWGLEKDLIIPFKEQNVKLEENRYYLTCLLLDNKTSRLYGSTKTNKYLDKCYNQDLLNEEVEILICENTDLGIKVVVNNRYSGMIFNSDISRNLKRGSKTIGYVSKLREDGKLDIRLDKTGYEKIDESFDQLLNILKVKGKLNLNDKSDPEEIRAKVGMSKKTFKQAVGKLYKARIITITDDGIELNQA